MAWSWDESLYAGSAAYYTRGRFPYPQELADALRDELGLDGTGRLLDVGCGPGPLTLLLAPLFERAVGIDADADMIAAARAEAALRGVGNAEFVRLRAEDLPARLGTFDVVTFAQSFHWMDRPSVAAAIKAMLQPAGVWVHVNASTLRGEGGDAGLPAPIPPYDAIAELVRVELGTVRRAGQSERPEDTPRAEEEVMVAAGYSGPTRLVVAGGRVVERTEDEVVASVFSRSGSAPHLFGERLGEFEAELRALLRETALDGRFRERTCEIELVLWRP